MTKSALKDAAAKQDQDAVENPAVKARKCLMCSTEFSSEWSGERICRKCKSSNAWRTA